jgi:hypothetical protein
MSATKGWAFLSEHGNARISAYRVKAMRDEIEGRPLGIPFWSTHRAWKRVKMKHVVKAGTPFFSYMDGEAGGGDEGGVSLSHLLYQEAIAQTPATELRLGKYGNHKITIIEATIEKRFDLTAGSRVVDVHLKFDSDSYLAKKWEGSVCIEVHHTHAVPRKKIEDLRLARMAVVEVHLPEAFLFPHTEDETTEQLESKHIEFLVRHLGDFIVGTVLSDPSSLEYLEEQLANAQRMLADASEKQQLQQQQIATLTESGGKHQELSVSLAGRLRTAENEIGSLKAALDVAQQDKRNVTSKAASEIQNLTQTLSLRTQKLTVASATSVLLLGVLIYVAILR